MSLRVQAMSPDHLPWLTQRSGCMLTNVLRGIEAVDEQGRIHGAVGFDGWMGNAAQMHIALDHPLALRALLRPAFQYLFGRGERECGKDIALGVVPAHNERALKFDTHIGFKPICRLRDGAAPGDDMILLQLRREDCRYLESK